MKKLFTGAIMALSVVMLSTMATSCEVNYVDSLQMKEGGLHLVSEGEVYKLSLNYFCLEDSERIYNDTITLDDEVKTSSTGFTKAKCKEVISSEKYGNYTIRRCSYSTAFEVIIPSFAHETYYHRLPFSFMAEEVWFDGKIVVEQPFIFEKRQSNLTELPVDNTEKDEIYAKYLLEFLIFVYQKYSGIKVAEFSYNYYVARLNKSVLNGIDGNNITIIVTYNYQL